MQHIFSPGSHNSWIPDFLKVPTPSQTLLGRGGNGITFAYTVSDTDFAVKEVCLLWTLRIEWISLIYKVVLKIVVLYFKIHFSTACMYIPEYYCSSNQIVIKNCCTLLVHMLFIFIRPNIAGVKFSCGVNLTIPTWFLCWLLYHFNLVAVSSLCLKWRVSTCIYTLSVNVVFVYTCTYMCWNISHIWNDTYTNYCRQFAGRSG